MSNFEVFLLHEEGKQYPKESILEALLKGRRVEMHPVDPCRAYYRNPETGVFFQVTLSPEIAASWKSRLRSEDREEGPPEEGLPGFEEEPPGGAGENEEEGGEPHKVEAAPVVLSASLLCPSFFGREMIALAEEIAGAAGLGLDCTETGEEKAEGGGERPAHAAGPQAPERLRSLWEEARRGLVRMILKETGGKLEVAIRQASCDGSCSARMPLTVWSAEKSEAWWRYGAARRSLEKELGGEGLQVPPLQVAQHGERVKSLCAIDAGQAAVLPRTDLVLLRRERERKGIFRTKRVVEEGIALGEAVWEILAPASEHRKEPAEHLVFRGPGGSGLRVRERLEALPLEPLDSARRTTLFGVIDFEPEAADSP